MEITEQITMVLLVFALLGGLLWFLKRRGLASLPLSPRRNAGTRRLEVLERASLTPQHSVHLIRVFDRVLLIGTAPSACTLLEMQVSKDLATTNAQNLARTAP